MAATSFYYTEILCDVQGFGIIYYFYHIIVYDNMWFKVIFLTIFHQTVEGKHYFLPPLRLNGDLPIFILPSEWSGFFIPPPPSLIVSVVITLNIFKERSAPEFI